jgi:membrane-bound ClpP family serine protease
LGGNVTTWQPSPNRGVTSDPDPQEWAYQPVTQAVVDLLAAAELSYPLAVLGVVCWLAAPGLLWLAVVGAALLTAGGAGLAMVPVSAGGITLLGFGTVSLAMEVLALPELGLHAIGAGASIGLGELFLPGPWSGAHPGIVLPLTVTDAGYIRAARAANTLRGTPVPVGLGRVHRLVPRPSP